MIKVDLDIEGYNYFWAQEGYQINGQKFTCSWVDVTYRVHDPNGFIREGCTEIISKSHVLQEIEFLSAHKDQELKEELQENFYGVPYKKLPTCVGVKHGFC